MPTKQTIPYSFGTFFITFTCCRWLPLLEITAGYDIVYDWFNHLKSKGHFINGYVIMPNHVHVLISFRRTDQLINTIIGNGKRFMAYQIVKRLEQSNKSDLLADLAGSVEQSRRSNNKKHDIWEPSFDWKECNSDRFTDQKLNYIHMNPCAGKWHLSKAPGTYIHSSCKFYDTGVQGIYSVEHVENMKDISLGTWI